MAQGFDHRVHHRDVKTGKINRVDNYSLTIVRGIRYYKRDGRWFDGAGVEIEDPQIKGDQVGVVPAGAGVPSPSPFSRSQVAMGAQEAPKLKT